MNTNDRHIVAIDLGSSKIALTVAEVSGENIQVLYYKETPSEGIRYSSIYNVMSSRGPIANAIHEAEEELGVKITQAVVGMPKFPIRQERSCASIPDRGEDAMISQDDVVILKNFAHTLYPLNDTKKETIYGSVAQSFSTEEDFQIKENEIIGMTGDTLEGDFKVFVGKKSDLNKIDRVMTDIEVAAMRKYFTAESTAKAVLTESEMENGVALIDFGGGSTSVSIYHDNVMRHYASIPFGGKNITQDIKMECQISERLAENIKLAFGACMPEKLQNLSDKILNIKSNGVEPDKQLTVKYLSEIVTARIEEIMMAILYEIDKSGFADMLRSGIVVTGGCANIPNLGSLIYDISGYKARIGYPNKCFSYQGCDAILEATAATSIGLILAAKNDKTVNCTVSEGPGVIATEPVVETPAGENGDPQGSLFGKSVEVIEVHEDTKEEKVVEKVEEKVKKEEVKEKGEKEEKPNSLRIIFKKFGKKVQTTINSLYENVNEDDEDETNRNDEDNNE